VTVRVEHAITLPPRSKNVVVVHCSKSQPLPTSDFEPKPIHGLSDVYATDCRIIRDIHGNFCISVLNVTNNPVHLHPRQCIGTLTSSNGTMHQVCSQSESQLEGFTTDITMGSCLSATKRNRLRNFVTAYSRIFAVNPRKPTVVTTMEHHIITEDSQPEKDSYPLPHACDVLDQMNGAKFWTTLDAASAYWSMPLSEKDKEKPHFPFHGVSLNLMLRLTAYVMLGPRTRE